MKKTRIYLALFALVTTAFITSSCEFGLGSQVDTDTPTIAIVNPEISSVKGGTVTVTGTCNDDAGVKRVELALRNPDGALMSLGNASISLTKTSWALTAPLGNFSDGSYSIVATAFDGAERKAVATREFAIDNTPPVVLLSKPNSFDQNDIGSGGFGKTVTISGEILDDSDIGSLTVKVYRKKADGTEEEVRLPHPTFTGFDVQGGLNLIIAQQNSTDAALSQNYEALYDSNGESTQYFTMVVTVADVAGNKNTTTYVKSALNKVVTAVTSVPVKNLISANYKKLLNGTYADTTFTEAQQQIVLDILNGVYTSAEHDVDPSKYMSSESGAHIVFTVCPDSSPKFELAGLAKDGEGETVYKAVESGGTITLSLEKGLDNKLIDPSSIDITLVECDKLGNIISGGETWTTKNASEGSNEYKAIYRKVNNTTQYLKAFSGDLDNSSWTFRLPTRLSGDQCFNVIVEGTDTDGNLLAPKMNVGYGFIVSLHGGAPQVICDDAEFFDGKYYTPQAFAASGQVKLKLSVIDSSQDHRFGSDPSPLRFTPTLYTGHHIDRVAAEEAVSAGKATKVELETISDSRDALGNYKYITKKTDSDYVVEIPLNNIDLASVVGNADNYTVILMVYASNGTASTTDWLLYADGKGPVIEVANTLNPTGVNNIQETSNGWSRVSTTELPDGTTVPAMTVNQYSMRGFWSDVNGSGTKNLYYKTVSASETINTTGLTPAILESSWSKVGVEDAPPDATDRSGVSKVSAVREGSGWKLAIVAVDNVGNLSEVTMYNDLTFDFAVPTVTVEPVSPYYSNDADDLTLVVTAHDSNLVQNLSVVAKKNGQTVSSGTNGYTIAYSAVTPRAASMNSADAYNTAKESTQTATITLKRNGDSDGEWSFTAVATDAVGRTSKTLAFSTIVDGTIPVVTGTVNVDGSAYSESKWYNKETMLITSAYKEQTSGLDSLYYKVLHGSTDPAPTDLTTDPQAEQSALPGTKGNSIAVQVTPTNFLSGLNRVFIQTTDKAGNKSDIAQYNVYADLDGSEISAERYTYDNRSYFSAKSVIRTNGERDLILYGLVQDAESGVADFKNGFKIDNTSLTASILYTTQTYDPDPNDEDAVNLWFKNAEWKPYASITDKAAITAYEATITKSKKEGSVILTASDNAGNELSQTLFTVTVDTDSPELTLTLPEENSSLNGKVTFKGTAKDTALDVVALHYTYTNPGNGTPTITANDEEIAYINGSDAYSWQFDDLELTYEEDGVLKLLGGETYTSGTKQIWFKVHALDSAGNSTVKKYAYIIDPDADRPVISLSNIASDGRTLLKNNVVYGSISDDDGTVKGLWYTDNASIATLPTTSEDNGWLPVTIENGTFTISDETGDGQKTWYFYCIDGADGNFSMLSANALKRPYLQCTNDATKKDNNTGISFSIDTTPPAIRTLKLSRATNATTTAAKDYTPSADGDDQWRAEDKVAFGGSKGKMYLYLEVEETTGMDANTPVAVSIDGKTLSLTTSQIYKTYDAEHTLYKYVIGPVDLRTGYTSKSQELDVSVTDSAGTTIVEPKTIIIDNEAPTVQVSSPTSNQWISSLVTIRGSVRDNAGGTGVTLVKYTIVPKSAVSTLSKSSAWSDNPEGTTLKVIFDSNVPNAEANILTYANATYSTNAGEGLWKVPIYFYVEDEMGNYSIVKDKYINVDADAGKPVATILNPKTNATVGGSLTVTGSARDDVNVENVRVQFDVNGDGKFDATDYSVISGPDWKSANGWGSTEDTTPLRGSASDWYLLADGTNTWKLSIKIPDVTANTLGSTKQLGIRACAYDSVPQTRGWNEVKVSVDKNTPQIGTLKLVKYDSSNNPIEEREYYSGIYINGTNNGETWKLEGTVTDNIMVSKVKFTNEEPDVGVNQIALDDTEYDNATDSYDISAVINASADGQVKATLTAIDNNKTVSEELILILVDRTAPKLFFESGIDSLRIKGGDMLDTEINSTHPIQDSNGMFRLGDAVVEAGSGLSYVAFYFERTSDTNGDRIYNPMVAPGNSDANRADIDGTNVKENAEGLVVRAITGATRSKENTLTHAAIKNNMQVRVGGLVKLAGVYRLITNVDTSTGTITFTPSVDKKFRDCELVYAQIVDNRMEEILTQSSIENDDGDGMAEFVDATGSEYSWNARISSSNIPDGPIQVHVVAIDAAGNFTHRYIPSSVQNNRPRIAKILLGTDLNGNAKYDFNADSALVYTGGKNDTASGSDFGEFRYYSTIDQSGKGKYDITIVDANPFIVKDGMLLLPEFTGGNTSIFATYKVDDVTNMAAKSTDDQTTRFTTSRYGPLTSKTAVTAKVSSTGSQNVVEHISAFGGFEVANSTLAGWEGRRFDTENPNTPLIYEKFFAITFWDETEETTQGANSQWALLRFPVIIDVVDDIAPEPKLTPFYWNKAKEALSVSVNSLKDTSNSVYKDAQGNLLGHIELSSEWQTSTYYTGLATKPTTGQYDADAKVSGIIRIQGTVSDEKRISTLSLQIGKGTGDAATGLDLGSGVNASKTLATYNPTVDGVKTGDWSTYEVDNLATAGWKFRILSNRIDQTGHFVDWELDIDTSFVKNKAGTRLYAETDQVLTITANDSAKQATDSVRVDIVPYITSVTTGLSEVGTEYARTALGHYPVYITREGFTNGNGNSMAYDTVRVSGYNLNAASATSGGVALTGSGTVFTLTDDAKSGDFELTVNNVVTLNNKNNNDSHGAYPEGSDYTAFTNYYNRQPNKKNNASLTDDVVLDVWDFNTKAAVGWQTQSLVSDVVMKVNPVSGILGFAFSNGSLRFSMPGIDNSYQIWNISYDYMTYNALAYDAHGYNYATSVGGDINASNSRDHFTLMTNRWGVVMYYNNGKVKQSSNKDAKNAIGLDTIGQGGNVAKNRFQSQSIATHAYTVDSIKTTDVYMAYYDFMNKEIRFKAGTFNTLAKPDLGIGAGIGTFIRRANNGDTNYNDTKKECQIIAATENEGTTLGSAGKYVNLAVTSANTVALVWYDGTDLQFTYTKTPLASATDATQRGLVKENGTIKGGWEAAEAILEGAGEECQIAVDSEGNAHIAAYDPTNADLVYVYIPTDGSDGFDLAKKIVSRVDSYLDVGQHLTIDVAKKNGQQIPYIGYWAAYPELPRYAYLADPTSFYAGTSVNGTTEKDSYTGIWECTVVPSTSTVKEGRANVALWKNNGNLAYSTYTVNNGSVSGFSGAQSGVNCYARSFVVDTGSENDPNTPTVTDDYGICYGNGSNNGVMAYVNSVNGSTSYIETAQCR